MGLRRIIVLLIALVAAGGSAMYARSWIEGQQAPSRRSPRQRRRNRSTRCWSPTPICPPAPSSSRSTCAGSAGRPMTCPRAMCSRACARTTRWSAPWCAAASRSASRSPTAPWSSRANAGFLAAVLEPGMRAVSVPVTPTSANSGLIFPGDRVDLILTQSLVESEERGQRSPGQRDRAERHPDHRHGRRDQRRPRRGQGQREGQDRDVRGHAGAGGEGRPADRARQAVAEPAQPGRGRRPRSRRCPKTPPSCTWDRDVSRVLRSGRLSSRLLVLRGSDAEDVSVQEGTEK